MGSQTPRTVRDPQATPRCQACGQPLGIVAKRHKVLGAWVPEWEVQPCRNARCELYVSPERVDQGGGDQAGEDPGGPGEARDVASEGGAEAATPHVTGKNGETGRSPAPG
ncbi:hypothetical protein ACFYV5_09040 [Streptomyces sp. NPDC003035]|uniref:hypothetical protein n=1 Tax=Streptomyces sp. NPDC003035 TaxID=3364676 RepID=UPI00369C20E4